MDIREALTILCEHSEDASPEDIESVMDWAKELGHQGERVLGVDQNTLKDVAHLMIHIFDRTAPPEDMLLKVALHSSQQHFASLLYSAALMSVVLLGYKPPDLAAALFKGLGIGTDDGPTE